MMNTFLRRLDDRITIGAVIACWIVPNLAVRQETAGGPRTLLEVPFFRTS